jgi:hypothetical protein
MRNLRGKAARIVERKVNAQEEAVPEAAAAAE